MPDKAFTGLTASVKVGAHATAEVVAYISGVDLKLDKEIIEILQFGGQFKEKVPAVKDWSASVEGTVAFSSDGTQKDLYDAYINGTLLTLGIYLDENNYFEGSAYVQSMTISAAPDDKISLSAELAGSGAVVMTLATV